MHVKMMTGGYLGTATGRSGMSKENNWVYEIIKSAKAESPGAT